MKLSLPDSVKYIIKRLEASGFCAYAVGGCVRDSLLMKAPSDWDIATNALPNQIADCFSDKKIIATGLKHGTLTVLIDRIPYEITTFRIDGKYTDNRRPENVTFTQELGCDLMRRDFTVNAMAYNESCGLVDFHGGIDDCKNKIIRCVGDPVQRFNEDGLRIMRALRFASVYGFSLDEATASAVHSQRELLKNISAERLFSELKKLICGAECEKILTQYRDVFAVIIPEIVPCFDYEQNNPNHDRPLWEHICASVANIKPDEALRFTMLLHDIAKPDCLTVDESSVSHFYGHPHKSAELADKILLRLKAPVKFRQEVTSLIDLHDLQLDAGKKAIRKIIGNYPDGTVQKLLSVRRADILAQSKLARDEKLIKLARLEKLVSEVISSEKCFKISDLEINGDDLTKLGMKPGKEMGEVLRTILDSVLSGKTENKRDELLSLAKKILQKSCDLSNIDNI